MSDRVLSQLLLEMDGIEELGSVTIVAATNRPDILDEALLRPGRLDAIIYVGPPDHEARKAIFGIQKQNMPWSNNTDISRLAELTNGFSGAECVAVCQKAALNALQDDMEANEIQCKYLEDAAKTTVKSITREMISFYEEFKNRSGVSNL